MKTLEINICRDFSKILGGGEKDRSANSGEEFRERFLDDNFGIYDKIIIDLDGVLGVPVDFMEAAFGDLARKHGAAAVREKLEFKDRTGFAIERIHYFIDHSS
ncbi:MAG: STAS-like domain-containing protein [Desulfobacterales bacterium]|nr:STAS-like domain-containing protein [Desulfobacterales bacterium]